MLTAYLSPSQAFPQQVNRPPDVKGREHVNPFLSGGQRPFTPPPRPLETCISAGNVMLCKKSLLSYSASVKLTFSAGLEHILQLKHCASCWGEVKAFALRSMRPGLGKAEPNKHGHKDGPGAWSWSPDADSRRARGPALEPKPRSHRALYSTKGQGAS